MTKKFAVWAILSVFILGLTAFAADNFGVGKTRSITFMEATKVGTTVLPAGEYKVQHLMDGSAHTLVFKSLEKNKEVARVTCTMEKLDKKADRTMSHINNVDNQRVLTGLIFAGDDYRHTF